MTVNKTLLPKRLCLYCFYWNCRNLLTSSRMKLYFFFYSGKCESKSLTDLDVLGLQKRVKCLNLELNLEIRMMQVCMLGSFLDCRWQRRGNNRLSAQNRGHLCWDPVMPGYFRDSAFGRSRSCTRNQQWTSRSVSLSLHNQISDTRL